MDEMRRLGSGTAPASGQPRRPGRNGQRRLAERAAQVPPASEPVTAPAAQLAPPAEKGDGGLQRAAGNGKDAKLAETPPTAPPAAAAQAGAQSEPKGGPHAASSDPPPPDAPSAAEMPQTAAIPAERRRMRLLDRITGLGKA
jgi:hypothetical protein